MTTEEKAALVEWAHKWIEPARRTVENNPQDDSAKASLALYEIALAALTNEPVYVPKGWRLVPVEPTVGMTEAGWDKLNVSGDMNCAYEAMIDAAPTP